MARKATPAVRTEPLTPTLLSRELGRDQHGYLGWTTTERQARIAPERAALLLCDVWDRHWCRGAEERLASLLPRMNEVAGALREKGALVVHAPSDTMPFYEDTPARRRVLDAKRAEPPEDAERDDPPLPVSAPGGGSDTDSDLADGGRIVWHRQHAAIEIHQERDAISDDGRELYSLYRERGIGTVVIMGVHTNMCILSRSFSIKQMVRWGFEVALVRDLTDAMYSPADPPYVSHAEGTQLVVEYIEKFWCPTLMSDELL